ncbi:phosphatase PAP2 family protein [Aurantiacibacter rhizosphaerae]
MHVAIAVLVALFLKERLPSLQWIGWVFAAIMYFGSIHLGYHYATDGIVSAVGVIFIWKMTSLYLAWLARLSPAPSSGTADALAAR